MTNYGWAILENIAILAAICFLVWASESAWWGVLVLFMNTTRAKVKDD